MWTVDAIKLKLTEARGIFVRRTQEQGEFWCVICDTWFDEKKMFQIVGHSAPDRIIVFGLCESCTAKADPDYVGAALGALNERTVKGKIERVDSRMKFYLLDRVLKRKKP